MLLQNVNIVGDNESSQIRVVGDTIEEIGTSATTIKADDNEFEIILDNALAFPGLINSHDHLDFDLFPRLANQVYSNYKEWGPDIHRYNNETIRAILKIPLQLRIEWGIYKNLLNGFTTVVHHGNHLNVEKPLIDIFQDCHSLHSVGIEKGWRLKLNNPFLKSWPFVVHVGEGTDKAAHQEIDQLIRWNLFNRPLVGVHGVAMDEKQARSFKALVWCPDSNLFLLNATARVDELKKHTKVLFGTDSTLSADWNAWNQFRLARKTKMLTGFELFETLTTAPAAVLTLNNRGSLKKGRKADVIVADRLNPNSSMESFFELNPQNILLVIKDGEVILFDKNLYSQLRNAGHANGFTEVSSGNRVKYVKGDLRTLINKLRHYHRVELPVGLEFQKNPYVEK